jgi:4-amino-4-deoxy-L-arabinose transferase-like glycosyltransferase
MLMKQAGRKSPASTEPRTGRNIGALVSMQIATRTLAGVVLLFLFGLTLRLIWWHFGPKVVESEGANYARIGENIAAGRGLFGLGGPEMGVFLLYPPLYSSLIAAGVKLGVASETAGRAVSLIFGALLPVVAWLFARRCFGRTTGWLAGLLAAIHPLLIALSTAVLTESASLTLNLTALYFALDAITSHSKRSTVACGVLLGLSYLLRPEAFILTFLLVLVILVANWTRLRAAALCGALLACVFALFAAPYIGVLWAQTGQLRFEAKTADAIRYATRLESGLNVGEIYFQIDKNLVELGNSNTSDLYQLQTTNVSILERARLVAKQAVENLPHLLRGASDLQLGAPFLIALAALGLFGVPWTASRLRLEMPLLCLTMMTIAAYATWPFFHDRFMYPLIPPLLVWAAAGLAKLGAWAGLTAANLNLRGASRHGLMAAVVLVPAVLVCTASAVGVRSSDELSQSWTDARLRDMVPVGQWLRGQGTSVRVMDTGPTVAFYADDDLVPFPWTDSATALRYMESKDLSYVILRDSDADRRPYLAAWLQNEPQDHLELIQTFHSVTGNTYVYGWLP